MTYEDFLISYFKRLEQWEDYRLGQHFCNLFIKDSSTPTMCRLWEERDFQKATGMILVLIDIYQWDYNDLPVIKERI